MKITKQLVVGNDLKISLTKLCIHLTSVVLSLQKLPDKNNYFVINDRNAIH